MIGWCSLAGFLPLSNHQSSIINLVLTHGIPPAFRDGVLIYCQPPSDKIRVYQVTQLRTNGVHHRESAGAGPVDLKAVRVTGATFSSNTMDQLTCALLFLRHIIGTVGMYDTERIVRVALKYKAPRSLACRRM